MHSPSGRAFDLALGASARLHASARKRHTQLVISPPRHGRVRREHGNNEQRASVSVTCVESERDAAHWTAPSSQQQSPSYTRQCTSSCFAGPSPLRTPHPFLRRTTLFHRPCPNGSAVWAMWSARACERDITGARARAKLRASARRRRLTQHRPREQLPHRGRLNLRFLSPLL